MPPGLIRLPNGKLVPRNSPAAKAYAKSQTRSDGTSVVSTTPTPKKVTVKTTKPFNPVSIFDLKTPDGKTVNPLRGTVFDPDTQPKPGKGPKAPPKTDWRYDPGGGYVEEKSGKAVPLAQTPEGRAAQNKTFIRIKKAEAARQEAESMARLRAKWAREDYLKSMKEVDNSLHFGKQHFSVMGLPFTSHLPTWDSTKRWVGQQASDLAQIPVGLGKLGVENFTTFYFHPNQYPKWLYNTVGAMLGNEGGLFTYVPDPTDKEDMRRFRQAWSQHTVMGALAVAPAVGAAARAGEAGAIASRAARVVPKMTTATEADAAAVAGWEGAAGSVGKNAARAIFTDPENVVTVRGPHGKPRAIAHIDRSGPNIIIHDIAADPAARGAGSELMNAIKGEAAKEGKGIVSPEVASEEAAKFHQKHGFKANKETTEHVLSPSAVQDFVVPNYAARLKLAYKETKRPGYMRAQGFEGGIAPRALGKGNPNLVLTTPEQFNEAMLKNPHPESLTVHTPEEFAGAQLLLSKDGKTGGALMPDGEMVNLFNNGGPKGAATNPVNGVMAELIRRGGTHLDVFDQPGLVAAYGRNGMVEVARMKYDPSFGPLPDGTMPDIVFMAKSDRPILGNYIDDFEVGTNLAKTVGLPNRTIGDFGGGAARPWSRSTLGRTIQGRYDNMSTRFADSMFKGAMGGKFTPFQRSARVVEKNGRRARQQFAQWLYRREHIIHKGIRDDPVRMEALIATLEAPIDMSPRLAVETKIKHLEQIQKPTPQIEAQIGLLKEALGDSFLESEPFANAVDAAMDLSHQADKMAQQTLGMTEDELAARRNLVAQEWVDSGLITNETEAGVPVVTGKTLDEVVSNMGAEFDHNQITLNTDAGPMVYDPKPYTRSPDPATERPLEYGFRAISEDEWNYIKTNGHLKSDERMNLSPDEGTVMSKDNPSFYLPGKLASDQPGVYTGRIIRVRLRPEDGWRYDHDGYLKTKKPVPITQIDAVSPPLTGTRSIRKTAGGNEVPSMPDFQPGSVLGSVEARGYFPHRSVFDPQAPVNPVAAQPGGNVVGTPQLGKAFTRKHNDLKRYYEGTVDTRPQSLSNTLRGRAAVQFKQSIRQYLYENGRPIAPGEPVPEGWYFVRNPFEKPERIRAEAKFAVEDPMLAMEKGDPFVMSAAEWRALNEAGDLPPEWQTSMQNVRMVPPEVVKTVLSDARNGGGNLSTVMGLMNALVRSAILHLPYGGARYVARNTAQNLLLMSITHPSAFLKLRTAMVDIFRNDRDLFDMIQTEAGSVQAGMGLPDTFRGRGKLKKFERAVVEGKDRNVGPVTMNFGLKNVGSKLGWAADEPYRVAAWIKYAEEYGFKGKAQWRKLITSDDPALVDVRNSIAQYVKEDMIDFDTLTPYEREVVSRWTFIYPFVKGASKWPVIYARDYPFRAGLMALIGAQARREQIPGMPQSEAEINKEGGHQWAWLSPVDPLFQNVQSGFALVNGFSNGRVNLAPLTDFLAPWLRQAGVAGFGDGVTYEQLERTFFPGFQTYKTVKKGGSFSDQIGRMMGYEQSTPDFRLKKREQDKAKLLEDWKLVGENYDLQAVANGFKAYEAYYDLKARADFAAKDLGRKLSKKEQAMLLTHIGRQYAPDAGWPDDSVLEKGHDFSDYVKLAQDALWGEMIRVKRAASRARSDANG